MINQIIVAGGIVLTVAMLFLDHFGTFSVGFFELVVIDILTLTFVKFITNKYTKRCALVGMVVLLVMHIFLFTNTSDWNEGRMSGVEYFVPFLQDVTDTLYALVLFSVFLLLVPLLGYLLFLTALVRSFCTKITRK